jgi:hypothetical protein
MTTSIRTLSTAVKNGTQHKSDMLIFEFTYCAVYLKLGVLEVYRVMTKQHSA